MNTLRGRTYFGNGITLNTIEAADDAANESMRNITAFRVYNRNEWVSRAPFLERSKLQNLTPKWIFLYISFKSLRM